MFLNARFKFNRPINKETDCLSIGGFSVTAGGEQYSFDFETYYGYVDKEDPTVVRYEGRNLDIETFPESKNLQDYALENIETLDECSIDTDDDGLYLTEVLDFSLCAERYLQIGRPKPKTTEYVEIEVEEFEKVEGYRVNCTLKPEVLEDYNYSHLLEMGDTLYKHTPDGHIVDGDTLLKDQIDSLEDNDYTGIFDEIVGIWKEAGSIEERRIVAKMFETFTGMKFKHYLEKCVKETTR